MAFTSLVTDEYQDDDSLIFKYEIPGLTWVFVGAKTGRETRKTTQLQLKYTDNPDVEYLHCLLSASTISFEGPLSRYPKTYRAPVLGEDDLPVIDAKTGKVKTKAHPQAGKKMGTTPDVLATMSEQVLSEVNTKLGEHWFGRNPAQQDDFRGEGAPVAEPKPEDV